MENFVTIGILVLFAILLIRVLLFPMKLIAKLAVHSACGFFCLWVLNTASGFTGIFLPVNAITVAIAGFLGLPGIGLIALLELAAK